MTSSTAPGTETSAPSSTSVSDDAFWDPDRRVQHEDWIGFLGTEPADADGLRGEGSDPDTAASEPSPAQPPPSVAVELADLSALLAGTSDDLLPER